MSTDNPFAPRRPQSDPAANFDLDSLADLEGDGSAPADSEPGQAESDRPLEMVDDDWSRSANNGAEPHDAPLDLTNEGAVVDATSESSLEAELRDEDALGDDLSFSSGAGGIHTDLGAEGAAEPDVEFSPSEMPAEEPLTFGDDRPAPLGEFAGDSFASSEAPSSDESLDSLESREAIDAPADLPVGEESAPFGASTELGEAAEAAPPAESDLGELEQGSPEVAAPEADPMVLAAFTDSLQGLRNQIAEFRFRWDTEQPGIAEHPQFAAVIADFEAEVDQLRERFGAYGLAPPEERTAELQPDRYPSEGQDADAGGFAFDEAPAAGATTTAARPKRASGGGGEGAMMWQMVHIVLGGALALPVAQLILWWLPFGLARDPVKLAPELPPYLEFLAPAEFRGSGTVTHPDPAEPAPRQQAVSRGAGRNGNGRGNSSRDVDTPELLVGPEFPAPVNPRIDDGPDSGLESPFIDPPPMLDPPAAPPEPPKPVLVGAPVTRVDQLGRTLPLLEKAYHTWAGYDGADADRRRQVTVDFYTRAAEMARAATFLDQSHEAAPERLGEAEGFVRSLGAEQEMPQKIGRIANSWIRNQKDDMAGVLMPGTVTDIRRQGEQHEVVVTILGVAQSPEVTIVTPRAPDEFQIGSQVFILGVLVKDPSATIPNYAGSASTAIWSSMIVRISDQ